MSLRSRPPVTECSVMHRAGCRRFHFGLLALVLMFAAVRPASAGGDGTAAPALAGGGVLDRVADSVEGAESSHGADPQMWRFDLEGPQGPMQVSAAAAADVGGGDRFDETQNRALGRAYLAQMYRRYGSWADAIAAYNWGPSRMTGWISGGRLPDKFPPGVARYRSRVLAVSGLPAGALVGVGPITARSARFEMLRLEARRELAERRRLGHRPEEVELLYAEIMRATYRAAR